jgi:hypothetical protein
LPSLGLIFVGEELDKEIKIFIDHFLFEVNLQPFSGDLITYTRRDTEKERVELTKRIFERFFERTVWTQLSLVELNSSYIPPASAESRSRKGFPTWKSFSKICVKLMI